MFKKNNYKIIIPTIAGAAAGALAASFLLPGYTPPINKKNKKQQSIASLEQIHIGGTDQWILMRSEDVVANPVLLILHGGPGMSELTFQRRHTQHLEAHFIVVNWDQRGAGKSFRAGRDASKMTINQLIEDTKELAAYLLQRFGKRKLILMGRSWGSALGMLTVSKYPGLFYAYVGVGQLSDVDKSEKLSYSWTLEQAHKRSDKKVVKKLEAMGPPPYTGNWLRKFNTQRRYVATYGGEVKGNPLGGNGKLVRSIFFSPEYTMADRMVYNNAAQRSLQLLQPQLMKVNLFTAVPRVNIPVLFAEGRYDQVVPCQLAAAYYDALKAPSKSLIWFEHSAHMPDIEEKELFHRVLIEQVRPLAVG